MYKAWMFKQRSFRLMDAATGDEGGHAGGGDSDAAAKAKADADAAATAKAEADAAAAKAEADAAAAKGVSDAEAKLLKEVMQKKDALKKTQDDLLAAQARLKDFDGIDPVAIKKLLADQKAAETASLEAKGEYDRVKTMMAEQHAAEKQTLQQQIDALQQALAQKDNTVNELSIGQQFATSNFIAEELTLTPNKARVIYGDHFDVVDGQVVPYDKPRGVSNRTPLVDQYGNNLGFEAALRKIVDNDADKDSLYRSKAKPGAGSGSTKSGKNVHTPPALDSVSKIEAGMGALNLLGTGGRIA